MLVNICLKFHEGILNGFWVTERTRPYHKIYYFQFQMAITPKIRNPELRFLRSARCLMLLYICVKFHENISNGFWVTERTRFCDRQTDGRANIWGLGASLSMIMRFIPLRIHWVALKPIFCLRFRGYFSMGSKKISNDQELIQSDPISCPQNQKENN